MISEISRHLADEMNMEHNLTYASFDAIKEQLHVKPGDYAQLAQLCELFHLGSWF